MASKRSRPINDPPSAESSEEEVEDEEEAASKQQQQQQPNEEEEEEEEEDEQEEEEEQDEEEEEEKEEPKTPVTKQQQQQQQEVDSDNEEQEEEEESDCDITHAPSTVIPARSVNKPTPTQLPKKQQDDVVEEKKGIINRLWSFNDEITVLQGIIQFKKQHNKDPSSSSDEFYNFVKNDLSNGKFTKAQLMDKVRRLKKKYRNHLSKFSQKDPEISNPHELKSFHLSKAIWGDLSGKTNSNAKLTLASLSDENGVVSNGDIVASGVRAAKKKKMKVDLGDVVMAESNEGGDDFKRLYPNLMNAFKGDGVYRLPLLDDLKSYLNLVDSSELKESDKKWKESHVAESELYLSRIVLVEETTRKVMDAVKSAQR